MVIGFFSCGILIEGIYWLIVVVVCFGVDFWNMCDMDWIVVIIFNS